MKCTEFSLKATILSSLFLWIFISCTHQGIVKVSVSETNDFPLLEIRHPSGPDIVFQPVSKDTGSIGFESGGEIFWLRGEPDQQYREDGKLDLVWNLDTGDRVRIRINENPDAPVLKLALVSADSLKKPEKWFIHARASEGEYFTGALERVVDGPQGDSWRQGIETAMDLRNERVEMKVKPTVSAYAPFYLSSNNYGLFVKGTWPGLFDFCKTHPGIVRIAFEGPELVFKLYLGSEPGEIVRKHALETGPSFVPPKWAFGPWRWRDEHRNGKTYFDGSEVKAPYNSEIVEDILMMDAYDIPCTAYWIDRPWGPGGFGFEDYEIDYERLPNFTEMITWLNGKGIELMLWICPWVYGDMAVVAREKGYGLVPRSMRRRFGRPPGPRPGGPDSPAGVDTARFNRFLRRMEREMGTMVVMDYSNPEACAWWGENGPGKLARMGVKGFKLDRGDGERLCDSLHLLTSAGLSYRENYNDYPRQYVKATYDAVEPVLGGDFVLFPRAQYTGSARYGAMWAGDTDNSDEGLRSALIALQRCAVMGYPLWTSDAGGYPKRLERETAMRWIGFACFCPIMEVGPTDNRGFWGMNYEPSYDHELLAVWRFYAKLRMSLADYVHDYAVAAHETGMPIARPLFMEYPEQDECWEEWETYKFGDDLLVSLAWENGRTTQRVYLPAGETWINLWDEQEYEGGQYLEVDAAVYKIPVFLRKGSDLELPGLSELYEESVALTSEKLQMSLLEEKEDWMK